MPRVTYSDPEVASIGISEARPSEQYGADKVTEFTYDLAGNGKSADHQTSGAVKVVAVAKDGARRRHPHGRRARRRTDRRSAADLQLGGHPGDVAALIHAHPTQNEALGEAHLALAGKPLHVHG